MQKTLPCSLEVSSNSSFTTSFISGFDRLKPFFKAFVLFTNYGLRIEFNCGWQALKGAKIKERERERERERESFYCSNWIPLSFRVSWKMCWVKILFPNSWHVVLIVCSSIKQFFKAFVLFAIIVCELNFNWGWQALKRPKKTNTHRVPFGRIESLYEF